MPNTIGPYEVLKLSPPPLWTNWHVQVYKRAGIISGWRTGYRGSDFMLRSESDHTSLSAALNQYVGGFANLIGTTQTVVWEGGQIPQHDRSLTVYVRNCRVISCVKWLWGVGGVNNQNADGTVEPGYLVCEWEMTGILVGAEP